MYLFINELIAATPPGNDGSMSGTSTITVGGIITPYPGPSSSIGPISIGHGSGVGLGSV